MVNSKEVKNGIEILEAKWFLVMDQNSQNVAWINNTRAVWPT